MIQSSMTGLECPLCGQESVEICYEGWDWVITCHDSVFAAGPGSCLLIGNCVSQQHALELYDILMTVANKAQHIYTTHAREAEL